ncbi:MAG TPA: NAD(P)H-hydrate dehydratase [Acidimicrobiales bacterium]|nr:NAD(P)H-hydrate dehydratase [Acidimicrobiales bacterium]
MTPDEMRAVDAAAPEGLDVLVERAGAAVARVALEELGGAYGRRVVVVCGKGNNGADGRVAARRLRARGVRVVELDAASASGSVLPACDVVIDAAYGTGFHGTYHAPDPLGAVIVAVDVPSGDVRADVTVTFAALKPALLFSDAAGAVLVEDIGLDVSSARIHVVEPADVLGRLPRRPRNAHKYAVGVAVVAGSPGMTGAAWLVSLAALRCGSGYCRLAIPGADVAAMVPSEAVAVPLAAEGWSSAALASCDRMRALAIGPGLGRAEATVGETKRVLAEAPIPVVVDADGLYALGSLDEAAEVLRSRVAPTLLTPHDGEFARLAGEAPPTGPERIETVRELAARLGATVLLKGPVTIVAAPDGEVLVSRHGPPSLATAGTGDVLTGICAAFLATGLSPLEAGGLGATAHATAAHAGHRVGLVAGDLPELVAAFLSGHGG